MAKVIQLRNESWLIDWIIDTTGKIEGETSFQITNRQSTYVLKCNYRFLRLTLSMSALDAESLVANHIPEKVAAVVDGEKEAMTKTEHGKWERTLNFECTRKPEFHLAFILDFPAIGEKQYAQYMSQLLTTGDMSDVTFIVKGEKLNAHKNIVSISPVLAAMFQGHFKEGRSNCVNIDDIDCNVFEQLLHYIYTGTAPLCDEQTMTEPLFLAADKYQMEGLKDVCVNILIDKLSLENVVHFLVVGHLYSAPTIEEASFQCLVKHRGKVWSRPEWTDLMTSYQDLFVKACRRMYADAEYDSE